MFLKQSPAKSRPVWYLTAEIFFVINDQKYFSRYIKKNLHIVCFE